MQSPAAYPKPPAAAVGYHLLLELHGCDLECLDSVPAVERILKQAADLAGATIVNSAFHHFSPYGVTGVLVIAESHIAAHTWPEYGYAAIDCFTCGDQTILEALERLIIAGFQAHEHSCSLIPRGAPTPPRSGAAPAGSPPGNDAAPAASPPRNDAAPAASPPGSNAAPAASPPGSGAAPAASPRTSRLA